LSIEIATSVAEAGRSGRIVFDLDRGCSYAQRCVRIGCAGLVKLLDLLVEIVVEAVAFHKRGVWLLELVGIELDVDGLDVVDELIDP
jgi:hypothetical protein